MVASGFERDVKQTLFDFQLGAPDQAANTSDVVRQRRIFPAVVAMAREIDRQQYIAGAWALRPVVVHQRGDKRRQAPGRRERDLQFIQSEAKHAALDIQAAQGRIPGQARLDAFGLGWREIPEQHLRHVVQQGGDDHFIGLDVIAQARPFTRMQRRVACAPDHGNQSLHRHFFRSEISIERTQIRKRAKKRRHSQHHDRVLDGGNLGHRVGAMPVLEKAQHAQRHQRIVQHHLGEIARAHIFLIGAQL